VRIVQPMLGRVLSCDVNSEPHLSTPAMPAAAARLLQVLPKGPHGFLQVRGNLGRHIRGALLAGMRLFAYMPTDHAAAACCSLVVAPYMCAAMHMFVPST
jgi:hypothetical protein